MDEQVLAHLKQAFAMDLWETVRAAKQSRGEHVFRHTMYAEGETMVFAALFPKEELMALPDMDEAFSRKLKKHNLLGVATDGKSSMDMFFLGGADKPLPALDSSEELMDIFEDEPLVEFMDVYFKARGMTLDIHNISLDGFLEMARQETFASSPLSDLDKLQDLLGN